MEVPRWSPSPKPNVHTSRERTIWDTVIARPGLGGSSDDSMEDYSFSDGDNGYEYGPEQRRKDLATPRWMSPAKQQEGRYSVDTINDKGDLVNTAIGPSQKVNFVTLASGLLCAEYNEFNTPQDVNTRLSTDARSNTPREELQLVRNELRNEGFQVPSNSSNYNEDGVWLTWKDLWVTASDPKHGNRPLLQGLTGYAEPGHVMAIMGPSGSGKSTLLDSLAGRLSSSTKQSGEILVNGRRKSLSYGNSAYVTQDDVLMATLTVHEAIFYSAQLQLPSSMSTLEKLERANSTIKEMGLQDAVNIRIGGWRARGLSGGEKRRVSIAIEILTHPRLLFLDEPTSGLDSAASFHVMQRLRHLATSGKTIIASIHQPSSDVFELFNTLYLLSNGRTVYFGAVGRAREFFASNGFPCPPMCNPSDHYLRMINSDFQKDMDIDIEGVQTPPLTTEQIIDILADAYENSEVMSGVFNRVNKLSKKHGTGQEIHSDHANFFTQVSVLTVRSFKNMYRDLGYYWLRLAIYISLCLCVGTIYYKVGYSYGSIQARAAMLMFVAAFLTFMAIGGFPSFVEDMKVFDRERLNGHYGVASFVVANTLSSIPYLLLISAIPGAIAYFLADLHHGANHFLYFVLTLFSCMILVESLMMMVASIVPDFLMGIITGAGIQGVFMLNGGFFRLPNDLPKPVWKYPVSYMAFHTYANQGFYKNDFEGLYFESNIHGSPPISGDSVLRNDYQVTMSYSKWVDLAILVGMAVLYRLIFFWLIKLKERLRPIIRSELSKRAALKIMFLDPRAA